MPYPSCTCANCRARVLLADISRTNLNQAYGQQASNDADPYDVDPYDGWENPPPYESERPILRAYSYTPEWRFNGDGPAFYGMEYEINCSDEERVMEVANNALGDLVIFKEDNSVDGVEIVTHPMDHPWADQHLNWDVFREIGQAGGHAVRSTNGIHVHVSRTAFSTESHLYRWMKLIYRNQRDVTRIARREESSWADFSPAHRKGHLAHVLKDKPPRRLPAGIVSDGYDGFYRVDLEHCYGNSRYDEPRVIYTRPDVRWVSQNGIHGWYPMRAIPYHEALRYQRLIYNDTTRQRYSAINTTNPDTLEVRVFASSTQPQRVRAALDLCSASVEYTRQLTAHDVAAEQGWEWDRFMSWTGSQEQFNYAALTSENERTSR